MLHLHHTLIISFVLYISIYDMLRQEEWCVYKHWSHDVRYLRYNRLWESIGLKSVMSIADVHDDIKSNHSSLIFQSNMYIITWVSNMICRSRQCFEPKIICKIGKPTLRLLMTSVAKSQGTSRYPWADTEKINCEKFKSISRRVGMKTPNNCIVATANTAHVQTLLV